MGLSQALSSALAGVNATQQGLSVIAGNVANANTPGYVDESVNQVEVAAYRPGRDERRRHRRQSQSQHAAAEPVVDRNVRRFLRRHDLATLSAAADRSTARRAHRPRSTAIYNNFTSALQALSTSPSSYSSQAAVVSAAQSVAQNLNSMTASIQQLRTQAEEGIANDVQTANSMMQQIAQINQQLSGSAPLRQLHGGA